MRHANKAKHLYELADKEWSRGHMRAAFRLFLAAAKAGNPSAFGIVAQFYDFGDGVKFNEQTALYWYLRAYRHGDTAVANNIGCILRDQNRLKAALQWFYRAVTHGDADANLEIGRIYLHRKRDPKTATRYLNAVCKAKNALEQSKELASELLNGIRSHLYAPRP